jgi:hypothetical protein
MIVDIEQRTKIPPTGLENSSIAEKPIVQGCAGEGGQNCNLHVIERDAARKLQHLLECIASVPIEAKDEAAIDRDPMGLNSAKCVNIAAGTPCLEV